MRKELIREDILDKKFIKETKNFKSFLLETKATLDKFDQSNPKKLEQEKIIENYKKKKNPIIIKHFNKIWEIVKDLPKNEYEIYQSYYQLNILPLLGEAEINRRIYNKPFGYSGDFVTMNYIYDYYNKYLGRSSFEKLINSLTCTIKISLSNIARKEFLKNEILNMISEKGPNVKIASIASGPARELIELQKESKINIPVNYICFDFERKALEFIKNELQKTNPSVKKNLNVTFISNNIIDIIRKPGVKKKLLHQDFIYAFGIYDYLSDIVAIKLTRSLFECLKDNGKLLICNASVDKSDLRAYYEFLGEWHMIYRTKNEMLQWVNNFATKEVYFRDEPNEAYLYLIMKK